MNNNIKLTGQSKADGDLLSKESFTLIVNIISIALIFGSFLNLAAQYFIYGDDLVKVLTLSGALLFLGCFMQIIMHLKLSMKAQTNFLIVIITILIPLLTLEFIEYGSITIWPFPFIFIIASLNFINRTMLIWVGISALSTQLIVWLMVPKLNIEIGAADYLVRFGLLSVGIVAAFYINRLYVKNLKENAYYLQKV
ncbi:MAG: hypothetical protein ACOX3R_15555 [Desulfitobacteriia bacterium]|jgi:hypothetical protein